MPKANLAGVLVVLMVSIASCTAPQYDDQTDQLISQLQTDVDSGIVSLISLDHQIARFSKRTDAASAKAAADAKAKATFASNIAFYNKVDVDLISLRTRVNAEPGPATSHINIAIKNLSDNLLAENDSMTAIHQRDDIITEPKLQIIQQLVDAQIGALLTLELGLKNGSAGTSK